MNQAHRHALEFRIHELEACKYTFYAHKHKLAAGSYKLKARRQELEAGRHLLKLTPALTTVKISYHYFDRSLYYIPRCLWIPTRSL